MSEKAYNPNAPYQKIPDACRTTGLSQYFLRRGCRDGSIPCVRSGTVYFIDMEGLMLKLKAEASNK